MCKQPILMVTTSFPRWKDDHAGHFVASLAIEMSTAHPVTVIAPDYPETDDQWLPRNVRVIRFTWPGSSRQDNLAYGDGILENIRSSPRHLLEVPFFLRSMKKTLKTTIASIRADSVLHAVIAHWLIPAGWIAAKLAPPDQRLLTICHGSDLHLVQRLPKFLGKRILRTLTLRKRIMVAVSSELSRQLVELLNDSSYPGFETIPMGPAILPDNVTVSSRSRNLTPDRPVEILFMGRLIPLKGVNHLIRSLESFPVSYHLNIVGAGPEKKHLMELAESLGINTQFHGHLTGHAKFQLLKRIDLAVIPSCASTTGQTDGAPTVFLEYLGLEIPVIATATGGILDLGHDGSNCLMCKPNDSTALKSALLSLTLKPQFRAQIVAGGQKTASRYSWRNITDKLLELVSDKETSPRVNQDHPNSTKS